jgi:hypothetical protein
VCRKKKLELSRFCDVSGFLKMLTVFSQRSETICFKYFFSNLLKVCCFNLSRQHARHHAVELYRVYKCNRLRPCSLQNVRGEHFFTEAVLRRCFAQSISYQDSFALGSFSFEIS